MEITLTRITSKPEKSDFKQFAVASFFANSPHLVGAFELISRLLRLLDNPGADCEEMAETIHADARLTEILVQRANSGSYAGFCRAASLSEAIMRLGMRKVHRLAMEAVTLRALTLSPFGLHARSLMRHSFVTATAAEVLAHRLTTENPEMVFCAALLHDIGKVVLAGVCGTEYFRLLEECAENNWDVESAEQRAFQTGHSEVAGELLRVCKFSQRISAAVASHHSPNNATNDSERLAALIYAANILAYRIGCGDGCPSYALAPDEFALAIVGLNGDALWDYQDKILEILRCGYDPRVNTAAMPSRSLLNLPRQTRARQGTPDSAFNAAITTDELVSNSTGRWRVVQN